MKNEVRKYAIDSLICHFSFGKPQRGPFVFIAASLQFGLAERNERDSHLSTDDRFDYLSQSAVLPILFSDSCYSKSYTKKKNIPK